jgi:DNA-binding NtrC family response regulator
MAAGVNEPKTILIVDDEVDVLAAIRRSLKHDGWTLLCVTDPFQAAEVLSRETIHVLLSDVDMPGMSGHELMRHARQVSPHTARLLVTGASTIESTLRAINEGEVHRYVCKPFDGAALRELVAAALARYDELREASEAGRMAERRRLLHAHLEAEHPGITRVRRDDTGAYVLDVLSIRDVAARLGLTPFLPE